MAVSLENRQDQPTTPGDETTRLSELSAGQLWHGAGTSSLRAAWKRDPHTDGWRQWRRRLEDSEAPELLLPGGKKKVHPLEWGADESLGAWMRWRGDVAAHVERGDQKALGALIDAWIDDADRRVADAEFALECLAWAYEAPALAQHVDSERWWRLVEHLVEVARQAVEASLGESPAPDDALAHQALGGELPLALTRLMPELDPVRRLRRPSVSVLSEGVLALTDGEGLVPARLLPRLPLLLACWTRCRAWADETGKPCWNADAETQFEWLVRQAVRLSRPDATLALGPAETRGAAALLAAALELAGDDSDYAGAAARLGKKALAEEADDAEPPEPSVNSEWSCLSVLAADWAPKSPRAVVTYEDDLSRLELAVGGRAVLTGDWVTEATVDGQPLTPDGEWDESCWFSDDDCDYLELSLPLSGEARLDRQIVVTRSDKAVYLADLVVTGQSEDRKITVTTRVPLAPGVHWMGERETREGRLVFDERELAGVVPPSLPEWRNDPRVGELLEEDGALVLRQEWTGRNVCCPLFIDGSPNRFNKQRTWRQLTIAAALERVSPDVAVAYRVQCGKDQWVAYRSLDPPGNRTFMGHNLSSECLFGRFLSTGEVDEYFEIEDD